MFDLIKKTMFTGLGLAFLTKEKIAELSKEVIEKGNLSEKEGKEFVDQLSRKAEDARKEVRGQIEKTVRDTLKTLNLATRDDLVRLEKKMKELDKVMKKKEPKG